MGTGSGSGSGAGAGSVTGSLVGAGSETGSLVGAGSETGPLVATGPLVGSATGSELDPPDGVPAEHPQNARAAIAAAAIAKMYRLVDAMFIHLIRSAVLNQLGRNERKCDCHQGKYSAAQQTGHESAGHAE